MDNKSRICAIIVAAGESQRMNGKDKLLALLGGKPVILWSIEAFEKCSLIDRIVIVTSPKNIESVRRLVVEQKATKIAGVCSGGKRRQDSVAAGLRQIQSCDWVVVHDGARPLVSAEIIERGLEAAAETGAAAAAVPVTDTIKIADAGCLVRETPDRNTLWAVQTPQIFRYDIIAGAYRNSGPDATDDASLVERSGHRVKLYQGSYDNIKITVQRDLAVAEAIMKDYVK